MIPPIVSDAVRRRIDIENEKHERERDQRESRCIDRQDRRQIKGKDQRNRAHHAGQDRAGRGQLTDDAIHRDEHENEHDFRSPELLKDAFGRRHLDLGDLRARGFERLAIDHAPVQLL